MQVLWDGRALNTVAQAKKIGHKPSRIDHIFLAKISPSQGLLNKQTMSQ